MRLIGKIREGVLASGLPTAICVHRPVLPSILEALELAPATLATGEMLVTHLTADDVHAIERHRRRLASARSSSPGAPTSAATAAAASDERVAKPYVRSSTERARAGSGRPHDPLVCCSPNRPRSDRKPA